MPRPKKKIDQRIYNGGAREGAGRKPKSDPKKTYAVYITEKQRDIIVEKYGSLTIAISSLI